MSQVIENIVGHGPEEPERPPDPTYSAVSLRSRMTAKILFAVGEGRVEGPPNPSNLLGSVYINNTPAADEYGNPNFDGISAQWRPGTPSQTYIPGFAQPEVSYSIATEVTQSTHVIRQITNPLADATKVIIQFPEGLYQQFEGGNGSIFDSQVTIQVDVQDDTIGLWYSAGQMTTKGTTYSGSYTRAIRVEKPSGATGNWSVRVRRADADATQFNRNKTVVAYINEILDVKESYNHTALLALTIDAASVGYQLPTVSVLWKWANDIKYPSNYNPITGVYSGPWGGTFNEGWTNNPAWVLMYLMLNVKSGTGDTIDISEIDTPSFYQAAQYCDELVDDGKGGTERRFTWNGTLQTREDAEKQLQVIAGSFNSVILWENGLWRLQQDRPSTPQWTITHANVVDGTFAYSGSPLQERTTVAHLSFTDAEQNYAQRPATVHESQYEAAYGYRDVQIAALGATTEGQAVRVGRWYIHTSCNAYDTIKFAAGLESHFWRVGDIIQVYDSYYSGKVTSGRLAVDTIGTTVVFDSAITIASGAKLICTAPDGSQQPEKTIANPAGTYTSVTIDSPYATQSTKYSVFGVITDVEPRLFRLMSKMSKDDNPTIFEWTGVVYDESKYAYVDNIDVIAVNPYSTTTLTSIAPVTNITWTPEFVNTGEVIIRRLHVAWNKSTTPTIIKYLVTWRRDGGQQHVVENVQSESIIIDDGSAGEYTISVFAIDFSGKQSLAATSTYDLNLDPGTSVTLNPVTNVRLFGINGLDYSGTQSFTQNFNIAWNNPVSNELLITTKDFQVTIKNSDTSQTKGVYYVEGVIPGMSQQFVYTHAQNMSDGGLARNITVEVRIRDATNKVSSATSAAFTNPSPPVPDNIVYNSVVDGGVSLRFDPSEQPDIAGYLVWGSQTNGFTPSDTTLLSDSTSNYQVFPDLDLATTYYFRIAAYDTFGKDYTGIGLNVSGQTAQTSGDLPGIANHNTLPLSGSVGDIIYLTTDKKIYRWNGSSWDAVVGDILANSITAAMMTANSIGTNQLIVGSVDASKINVSNLSAISADMGSITAGSIDIGPNKFTVDNTGQVIIRNASSGGRMEIHNNQILVYDDSGVLRVKMGFIS